MSLHVQKPSKIKIVEVGPRDGLQNEKATIETADKIQLIEQLALTGLNDIEITSFVSPKAIPQLADNQPVAEAIISRHNSNITYWALVPNIKGMENALRSGIRHVAVFTAASETFNQRNINKSIAEAIEAFRPVFDLAKQEDVAVRGYLSTAFYCPYEGKIAPERVLQAAIPLMELGVCELSIGDTIGKATPEDVEALLPILLNNIPTHQLAMHFHDTYGHALENIKSCLNAGIATYDSSIAGLGGCPYAPGASGNVSTEAVVNLMHSLGIETGIDLAKLSQVGQWIQTLIADARSRLA